MQPVLPILGHLVVYAQISVLWCVFLDARTVSWCTFRGISVIIKCCILSSNAACVVEEFYEYPNPCSGIVNVMTISGTNTTWFAVNVSGIESIRSAVLLNASSYFCGKETMNGSTGDVILCEAELHNWSRSVLGTGTDDYLALFRCPGDATLVPEGPAKIVFERNLTSNLTAECQMLTPSTPYTSDYSGFQIEWRHPGELVQS